MAGKMSALFVVCVALLALSPTQAARDIVDLQEFGLGRVDMGALRKLTQFNFGSDSPSGTDGSGFDFPGNNPSSPPEASSPASVPSPPSSPSPSPASAPTGVSASDNGDGTVTVSFSSSGSSFVAEAVPAGSSQGSASNPSKSGSSSPITLSTSDGLESGTTYTFYVTLNSDGQSLVSSPSSPVAFTTGSDASPAAANASPAAADASPVSGSGASPVSSRLAVGPAVETGASPATTQTGGAAPAAEGDVSAIADAEANLGIASNLGGDDTDGEVDKAFVGSVSEASTPADVAALVAGKSGSVKSCGVAFAAGIKSGKSVTTLCHGWGTAVIEAVKEGKTKDALNICSSSVIGIVLVSVNVSVTVATQACSELVIFIISSGSCTVIVKQFILNLFSIIISISTKSTAFVIA
ncbi:hypothetical protein ACKKBG_A34270 [Auxenochlorella protothecoides x Auxenochlorella symbiontica]